MPTIWAGIDARQAGTSLRGGRPGRQGAAVDEGRNDERALIGRIGTVDKLAAAGGACWATDLNAGGAALLIALLAAHAQRVLWGASRGVSPSALWAALERRGRYIAV